jgi:hypothetical protein
MRSGLGKCGKARWCRNADLKLEQLVVLYPGSRTYELEPGVRVLPFDTLAGATIDALFPEVAKGDSYQLPDD